MRKAVLVLGYKRPRYLYLTLQGLFRVRGIEDYDVFVFIDGNKEYKKANKKVISHFNVKKSIFRKYRLNGLLHTTHSLKTVFDYGYDSILYIENDYLLRPDTIEYIEEAKKDCFFLSLIRKQPDRKVRRQNKLKDGIDLQMREKKIIQAFRDGRNKVEHQFGSSDIFQSYSPRGNLILASDFEELFNYTVRLEFMGKKRLPKGGTLNSVWGGHDKVFNRFLNDKNHCCRYADKHYIFHFGVCGWHQKDKEIEKKIFVGSRKEWFDNLVSIANQESYNNQVLSKLREFRYV